MSIPTRNAVEAARQANLRHGDARLGAATPEYQAWSQLKRRCLNPWDHAHDRYGGRGIGVYEGWLTDFQRFLADVGRRPTAQHSIDRINNDGPYAPGNVRWATKQEQARNRRGRQRVTIGDETRLICEWAETSGLAIGRIWKRLSVGWPPARAVFEPLRADRRRREAR